MFDFWLGVVSGMSIGVALMGAAVVIYLEKEIKKWKK